jgi:hypothetical protein
MCTSKCESESVYIISLLLCLYSIGHDLNSRWWGPDVILPKRSGFPLFQEPSSTVDIPHIEEIT